MGLQDIVTKLRNEGVNIKVNANEIEKEKKAEIVTVMPEFKEIVKKPRPSKTKLIPGLATGNLSNILKWVCENPSITVEDCTKKCTELGYVVRLQSVKDYWRIAQTILKMLRDLNKLKE